MKKKIIILTEQEVLKSITDFYLDVAEAEVIAEEVGDLYGGRCHPYFDPDAGTDKMLYEFTPDDNYCGYFGDI
jgi:hypothetical protein